MSDATTLPIGPSASALPSLPQSVRRTPFYFESQGQWLFAWLHGPEHALPSDHGAIICPPIGHEQVHAHRSLRHLADALAEAKCSVVRFDYHGTGDSSGSDENLDRVAIWLANIRDARLWLKDQLGCKRVSLIGLRLGATLAAHAAAVRAVDDLLLWAPVVKGRSYVREMKALSLTAADNSRSSTEKPEGIEAAGFVLSEKTAQELSRLDLVQSRPLCRRALIITRDDTPNDTKLLEHFKSLGIEARQTAQPGYADMMAEPHYSKVPGEVIAHAVDWLLTVPRIEDKTHEKVDANHARRPPTLIPHAPTVGYTFLCQQRIRERVLPISQQPNLFGIVSDLPDVALDRLPFIVMINAGSSYRVGPNRLYVSLARQLAARGFRCLRMDLCGLGDSVTPYSERENDPYPATAFRDIDLTLEHLRSQFGIQRVVLMGLCSGAYAAFQAAAQLSTPVLVESVLINPLTYYWGDDMSLEVSPALRLKSFQDGVASVRQPGKWLKLLSGRSKLGITGAMRMLVERWKLRKLPERKASLPSGEAILAGFPSHPLQEDLPGDLKRIVKAGRHLGCFFARSDPGYDLLTLYARREVNELRCAGRMSVYFLDDADHTFSRRAPRRALGRAIAEHLDRRYLSTVP